MQSIFDIKKEEDLYIVLGCVDTSSSEQIKTEYKRLALQYHPDKCSNQESKFEKVKAAYDILGDPVKKAQYDRWKASGLIVPFSDFVQLGTHAQVHKNISLLVPKNLSHLYRLFIGKHFYSLKITKDPYRIQQFLENKRLHN
ncbi:DnaJ domain-containing protein [Sporodiniella umbellata]|nr:DnaJ domain-containing protein [Sporodiniella umbellata]